MCNKCLLNADLGKGLLRALGGSIKRDLQGPCAQGARGVVRVGLQTIHR